MEQGQSIVYTALLNAIFSVILRNRNFDFAEMSKNLGRYINFKIILSNYQNNYIENSST